MYKTTHTAALPKNFYKPSRGRTDRRCSSVTQPGKQAWTHRVIPCRQIRQSMGTAATVGTGKRREDLPEESNANALTTPSGRHGGTNPISGAGQPGAAIVDRLASSFGSLDWKGFSMETPEPGSLHSQATILPEPNADMRRVGSINTLIAEQGIVLAGDSQTSDD